jgi:hypothetical protein
MAMHKAMYQGKLRECLRDKRIDDADAAALERTARLLCLNDADVAEMDAELKGDVLREAMRAAMGAGVERFAPALADDVEAAKEAMRLDDAAAFGVLKDMARAELVKMINAARNKSALPPPLPAGRTWHTLCKPCACVQARSWTTRASCARWCTSATWCWRRWWAPPRARPRTRRRPAQCRSWPRPWPRRASRRRPRPRQPLQVRPLANAPCSVPAAHSAVRLASAWC